MKYAWIARHKEYWPVTLQCEVLNVSASGYFEHQRRKDSDRPATPGKRLGDAALLVHIKAAYAASKGESGWPQIWRELRASGVCVWKERVRKLMKQHGFKARGKRKFACAAVFRARIQGISFRILRGIKSTLRWTCRMNQHSVFTTPKRTPEMKISPRKF